MDALLSAIVRLVDGGSSILLFLPLVGPPHQPTGVLLRVFLLFGAVVATAAPDVADTIFVGMLRHCCCCVLGDISSCLLATYVMTVLVALPLLV